ncbi:DUF3159 domain-containing protein [Agromyces archimandritae]|uniref:DUF3159 domain-containing protein n=1 Tax=Agromyces archimandritae TaxID=2781962 RepID=UPI001FD11120|nr:DUF3159 domain-containing protein [Agromyces archimandritae]
MRNDADPSAEPDEPEAAEAFGEQLAKAAERSGLGGLARDESLSAKDLLGALGGVRGLVEAILPGLVFLVTYTITRELVISLIASVGLAIVFTAIRLVMRSQPAQAIAGLLGAGVSAVLALWTGDARDNYVLGFFTNIAYAVAIVVSIAVRWPLVGLIVGFLMGEGTAWRENRRKLRIMQVATFVWLGLFVSRLAVQVPLYLVDNVEALGAMRLLMGVPLYALVLIATWLLVRVAYPSQTRSR